jgi:hypothetical protein
LIIQDANVSANFQKWLVSGTPIPNTGSGYVQYPVTLVTSGGSSNFANNHEIILALVTTGPEGPTGSTGPTGPVASDALEWTTYSPAWTASTTNPAIGDGTITGRYKAIGKTVFVSVKINMGTTTTYGSGTWRISLPVDAFSASSAIFPTLFLDNGSNWFQGTSYTEYGGSVSYVTPVWDKGATGSAAVDSVTPFTWVSTDSFSFAGSYESV